MAKINAPRMRYFLTSLALFTLTCLASISAFSQTLSCSIDGASTSNIAIPQGSCICYKNTSTNVNSRCIYQIKSDGAGADELRRQANNLVKNSIVDPDRVLPYFGQGKSTIVWWFNDDQSNQEMGKLLKESDNRYLLLVNDRVVITTTMYSFKKDYTRKLGLNVGMFYGNNSGNSGNISTGGDLASKFASVLGNGLFNAVSGIGNPIASYIQLGVDATIDNQNAESTYQITYDCEVGAYCSIKHISHYYVQGISYSANVVDDDVGIEIKTTPFLDSANPKQVTLSNLMLSYSARNEDLTMPVNHFVLYDNRDLDLKTDEIYVLGSETSTANGKSRELIATEKSEKFSKILMLIKVQVIRGSQANAPLQFSIPKSITEYTDEELAALPVNTYSISDILNSVETVCFPNYLEPMTQESICGFRFAKMDKKYLKTKLDITLKGGSKTSLSPLNKQCTTLGCLYKSKGYFVIPVTEPGKKDYQIKFELEKGNSAADKIRALETVKGIEFPFSFDPTLPVGNMSNPMTFESSLIKIITK